MSVSREMRIKVKGMQYHCGVYDDGVVIINYLLIEKWSIVIIDLFSVFHPYLLHYISVVMGASDTDEK